MSFSADRFLKECVIKLDGEVISQEAVVKEYALFLEQLINSDEHQAAFALHTGSVIFDVISVLMTAIVTLDPTSEKDTDDIISTWPEGCMVLFDGERYRWGGISEEEIGTCFVLEQDGTSKIKNPRRKLLYEKNKQRLERYYGDSQRTDGRGIRQKDDSNRRGFVSLVFDIPDSEIPIENDASIVVVDYQGNFRDIYKRTSVSYGSMENIGLPEIFSAAYFTQQGSEHPLGPNPNKADATIKVTSSITYARQLVLDKQANKVAATIVLDHGRINEDSTEFPDLLNRKSLQFALVASPRDSSLERYALSQEDAVIFACTKERLRTIDCSTRIPNSYTDELSRQVDDIVGGEVAACKVSGGITEQAYEDIYQKLSKIRRAPLEEELKQEFISRAFAVLNLVKTAPFSMQDMEKAIADVEALQNVTTPKTHLEQMQSIFGNTDTMQEERRHVVSVLQELYNDFYEGTPKADMLLDYLGQSIEGNIAIIVPRAYYGTIIEESVSDLVEQDKILCFTPKSFDYKKQYALVIIVGEFKDLKYLHKLPTANVHELIYECEEEPFRRRQHERDKNEADLNLRMGAVRQSEVTQRPQDSRNQWAESEEFSALEDYINSTNEFDIRRYIPKISSDSSAPKAEITHVGIFTTGEQALFSKYYSAVVYDLSESKVIEKPPSELLPGDLLIFTKRSKESQNIVDTIYRWLIESNQLSEQSRNAYQKAQVWKEALRKYKDKYALSYRALTRNLHSFGSSLQEVAIRQWLAEDSHIIGPKEEVTMEQIAKMTHDPRLLSDIEGHFDACRMVRRERRRIFGYIEQAIKDKLSGLHPSEQDVLGGYIYNRVDELSETLELFEISELDEHQIVNGNLANKPMSEVEVAL